MGGRKEGRCKRGGQEGGSSLWEGELWDEEKGNILKSRECEEISERRYSDCMVAIFRKQNPGITKKTIFPNQI